MHFLKEIIIAILSGYLAFTNTLAGQINDFFLPEENVPLEDSETLGDKLSNLPSLIGRAIPDILLRSTEYQQAAITSAVSLTGATTDDPLEAIVNIFCTFTTSEYIRTTTGTGFFIDPDGVIMTNAHVAQFLMLEETDTFGETECIVRNGNPAAPKYKAELLYLPPAWIQSNSTVITDAHPTGTGERDYALLYVSASIDDSPLPAKFPALSFDTDLLPISTQNALVVAAGYPADNLMKNGPSADLVPQKATTTVSELYTFGSNYADVFSIRGSAVGAEGASGGPVLNEAGNVIGIIVTRGDDEVDGERSLRAITLSHVERTLEEETGLTLAQQVEGNLPHRAKVFSETLTPFLIRILQNYQTN